MQRTLQTLLLALLTTLALGALAQEATIRKNIATRLPQLKAIDEVRKTDLPGIFELRVNGTEIYYTDAQANYLIDGSLIDTRNRRNLTEERVEKLTAIQFDTLPIKDAFTIVRVERDLQKVDNVTIYLFLYPILGADSTEKSKAIWCAKDRVLAWQDWMLRDQAAPAAVAMCDTGALARNVEVGRKHKITGTPTLLFTNGARVPGAVDTKKIEQMLAEATKG